jgi:NRAMP (natural resistance-associated macrophage protein)-like metal ion transporter
MRFRRQRKQTVWQRIVLILAIIGPGIIAATADNDAGGITTYSMAGAHFGYGLLWVVFLITFSLAATQEMGARLGVVTGKGLADLIRENFGVKLTLFAMVTMLVANLGTTTAEFAGIAASGELIGVSKYLSVPLMSLIVWLVLYKGSFKTAEKIFLAFASFYIVYLINGWLVKPDLGHAITSLITPSFQFDSGYILLFIAVVGTTITPWGQFFIQSYVVDKGLKIDDYRYEKWEVYFGAFLTNIITFFIIVTTANTLFKNGIHIQSAYDAGLSLKPIAGQLAQELFAFGLFAASMLGAFILPTATSYAICEAFGWESGFDRTWREAKKFYGIILFSIFFSVLIVLIPKIPLIKIMVAAQSLNGILLPVILIYLLRLINKKELMGKYTNSLLMNIISWATIISIVVVTFLLFTFGFWQKVLHL